MCQPRTCGSIARPLELARHFSFIIKSKLKSTSVPSKMELEWHRFALKNPLSLLLNNATFAYPRISISHVKDLVLAHPRLSLAAGCSGAVLLSGAWLLWKRPAVVDETSLFTSMDSEQIANSFCSEAEALFPFPTRGTTVATFLGRTRVLCMGPETAPPLVIWHAWNTPASLDFQMWGEWSTSFRIYCPAMPGQPGGVVLLPGVNFSEVCGKWAVEVLDGLGIEQCAMFGVSVGCSVLLSVAQIAAPRVSHIALVNPINVLPPTWAMSMRYSHFDKCYYHSPW